MAKKPESAAVTLDEIQGLGDRLAEWISTNSTLVLGVGVGVLVIAGAIGLVRSSQTTALEEASTALARVDGEFREAMGAPAEAVEIVEPANPQTALSARTRFVGLYREVAEAHAGTPVEALAWLEVGSLQAALGEPDEAIATWQQAVDATDSGAPARALLMSRIAAEHEAAERWLEAAKAFEAAGAVTDYPLRFAALSDAARCYIEAAEHAVALAIFERIETDAPEYTIPEVTRARLLELRATTGSESDTAAAGDAAE